MKLLELQELAEQGNLRVTKRPWRIVYREKGWRGQKWEDTTNANWDSTRIAYQMYSYEARTPDMDEHQCYRITKKDYALLSEIINK